MKRVLSLVLATVLCISLLPTFAYAAVTETTTDGVIDFKISTDVLSTSEYPTDAKYALPEFAKTNLGTNANTIKNATSYFMDKYATVQNAETQFFSYREAGFYLAGTTPIKPPLYSENGIDTTKLYYFPATLDLTKTEPYELMGRSYCDNSNIVNATGLYIGWITKSSSGTEHVKNNDLKRRPNYMIRIKIDESQVGKYKLTAYNNFTYNEGTGKINGHTLAYATKGYNAVPKVSFVKISDDFEFKHLNTAKVEDATADEGKSNLAAYYKNATELGYYDSNAGNSVEFTPELELTAGEYLVIFEINTTSLDKQPKTANYSNNAIQNFLLSGIKLTPVVVSEEEKAMMEAIAEEVSEIGLSDTSYVNIITASVDSADVAFEATTEKIKATRGENITVTADTVEGYDFLYWRRGLGADTKVITNNPECTVKAIPGTWLTAVYKAETSEKVSVLFYNADGVIIKNELVDIDTAITFPSTPTAPAGCGEFSGWALNTKNNIVSEAKAAGNSMVFVAQFEESAEKNITVTVPTDATGGGYYAYGEKVTVNADATSDNKTFAYWKKGEEVVSFDSNYTFRVWEDCELTAVYLSKVPELEALRKIIIKGGMAEFIGLDSAVEKGIIFRDIDETPVTLGNATHKIAMTTTGNQLAFKNDLTRNGATNYTGYAILSDGKVIYDK